MASTQPEFSQFARTIISICFLLLIPVLALGSAGCSFIAPPPTPTITPSPTPTQVPTSTPKPLITPTPSPQEQEAFGDIPCMDAQALQDFISAYSSGTYGNYVNLSLYLLDKTEAIESGVLEPGFIIPFDQLGSRWQDWMLEMPETESVGYFVDADHMGIFFPFPGCGISFDGYGFPMTPTGNGSIVAFRTGGLQFGYLNDIVIESYGEEVLYFAVIEGLGIVHLHGWGKVTLPDGTEHQVK